MTAWAPGIRQSGVVGWRSAAAGAVGGIALLGWYLGIIMLAQGPAHALEQFAADAPFVLAVTLGFGTQIALFLGARVGNRSAGAADGQRRRAEGSSG